MDYMYRLLEKDEIIKDGDQYYDAEASNEWKDAYCYLGYKIGSNDIWFPVRRKINPHNKDSQDV